MEGIDGIFNWEDQCDPFMSPRWKESQKFLTDEVNGAPEGLFHGGASDVVVADLHDDSHSLSVAHVHPKTRLLPGHGIPAMPSVGASYSAVRSVEPCGPGSAATRMVNYDALSVYIGYDR